jgi:Tfp pilus assembly protein PilF
MAYLKNNQKEEAKVALEKALKLNKKFPGYEEARKALVDMR